MICPHCHKEIEEKVPQYNDPVFIRGQETRVIQIIKTPVQKFHFQTGKRGTQSGTTEPFPIVIVEQLSPPLGLEAIAGAGAVPADRADQTRA